MHVAALESWRPTNLALLNFFFFFFWHGSLKKTNYKLEIILSHNMQPLLYLLIFSPFAVYDTSAEYTMKNEQY